MIASKLLCLVALVALVAAAPTSEEEVERITYGRISYPGQFPSKVSLNLDDIPTAIGNILSTTWVITSALPVQPTASTPSRWSLWADTITGNDGVRYSIASVVVHPSYDPLSPKYKNLALLSTTTPIDYAPGRIRPLSLPADDFVDGKRLWGTAAGLNRLETNVPRFSVYIIAQTIPLSECRSRLLWPTTDTTLDTKFVCVQNLEQSSSIRTQGHALILSRTKTEIEAVYSFGLSTYSLDPEVYTRVAPELTFIRGVTGITT